VGVKGRGLALLLLLGGCASATASRTVTVGDALAELQRQLREAGAVNPATADPGQLATAARAEQCAAMSADPEVPLLAHDITVTLSGSFTATGGFSVGNAVLGSGLNASATRGQTQQLTLPLTFVALSGVADAIETGRLAAIPASLDPAGRRAAVARARDERRAVAARIDALVRDWTPALCQPPPAGGSGVTSRTHP
jgi:hypothetical protein